MILSWRYRGRRWYQWSLVYAAATMALVALFCAFHDHVGTAIALGWGMLLLRDSAMLDSELQSAHTLYKALEATHTQLVGRIALAKQQAGIGSGKIVSPHGGNRRGGGLIL